MLNNFIKLSGAYSMVRGLSGIVSEGVTKDMEDELEKTAKKLADSMKEGIAHDRYGLKPKSDFTLSVLESHGQGGKTIPLVVNADLVNSITYKEYKGNDIVFKSGGLNRFKAYFCGVHRTAGVHERSGGVFEGQKYTLGRVYIAKLLVLGFTAKLPRGGKAKVPPRDFVTPAKDELWKEHGKQFLHGFINSWRVRAFGGTSRGFTSF